MKGIDCATPLTKTAPGIAAAGYGFAARYLVPDGYAKHLSRAEAEAITAAGMNIVSVFETSAARPLGGAAAGKGDAQSALNCARKIGQPKGSAIYFTADFDVTTAPQYDAVENYLRAATLVLGDEYAVGIYGEYSVIEEMWKRKACTHFWQTYAWSKKQVSSHANIYQHLNGQRVAGVAVDLNESYGGEGWWNLKPVEVVKPADPNLVTVCVDGKKVADGRLENGKTWVELRAVAEALGTNVSWDAKTKTVNLS